MSLCKVQIIGNSGQKDVELRYTAKGTPVGSFSVAVGDKIDNEPVTNWFKVTVFGALAEYLSKDGTPFDKGIQVFVSGRLSFRPYTDKAGTQRISYDIVADEVQCFSKSEKADKPVEKPKPASKPAIDDTIPF